MSGAKVQAATDRQGRELVPGDRVRIRTYPRGTVEGTIEAHPRGVHVFHGSEDLGIALVVRTDAGTIYEFSTKATTKLKRR